MSATYQSGWFQVAFRDEIDHGITPIAFGDRRLAAMRNESGIRVFDATCPHRGAHLGYGGRADPQGVVCPFHGNKVALGRMESGFCVREYETAICDEMVFVCLSDASTPDLAAALKELGDNYTFVKGFTLDVDTSVELVIENALDSAHFKEVHGLEAVPLLKMHYGSYGELIGEGTFLIPTPFETARVGFKARVFSPGIVVSELSGEPPYDYVVISAAVPREQISKCTVRLTVAIKSTGEQSSQELADFLISEGRKGLELDQAIWNHLAVDHQPQWSDIDQPLIEFADFCQQFRSSEDLQVQLK